MASLYEQYRPGTFADVIGQDAAVRQVQRVIARSWGGRAWFITGPSGTGKTTIARCIASHGADDLAIQELDAQWLTPTRLQDIEGEMRYRMLGTKPGKAYIVNEAHAISPATIRALLVLLERLPEHVTFIFTTTKQGEARLFGDDDAAPLLSRCTLVNLVYDEQAQAAFAKRARDIAKAEGIDGLPLSVYESAVAASNGNFRRVLGKIESGTFAADALPVLQREFDMIKATKGEAYEARRVALQRAMASAKAQS